MVLVRTLVFFFRVWEGVRTRRRIYTSGGRYKPDRLSRGGAPALHT